jgi:hypothetical protein
MDRRSPRPKDGGADPAHGQCLRHVNGNDGQVATAEARADEPPAAASQSS